MLEMLETSADNLAKTIADLDDAAVAAPSALPGWTRGHVLTHVARNADALVNLLTWARTGVETPAYPSREARDAGIEAGAGRPLREQVEDLRARAAGGAAQLNSTVKAAERAAAIADEQAERDAAHAAGPVAQKKERGRSENLDPEIEA